MPQDPLMPQTPQPKAKPSIDEWEEQVRQKYNIPQKLWRGMAAQESGGDRNAVSPTGVRGKYQVTESTAKSYGLDRNDPYQQAEAAAKHLRQMYDTTPQIKSDSGRWWGAVAKYYGGGNAVDDQGNFSDSSVDGVSTPLRHVNSLARRIQEMDKQTPSVVNPQNPAAPTVAPAPKPTPMKARPKPVTTARGPIVQPTQISPLSFTGNAAPSSEKLTAQSQQIAQQIRPEIQAKQPKPNPFEQRSPIGQFGEMVGAAGLRAAEHLNKAASLAIGSRRLVPSAGEPLLSPVAQNALRQQEVRQDEAYPNAAPIVRGITQGAIEAPAYMLGGAAGTIPAIATAAGLSAIDQDWEKDPKRAALRTAAGSVLPVLGGKALSSVAGRVAPNLVAKSLGGRAVETVGGAAGNVAPAAAEQLYYDRELNLNELGKQAVIGGALGFGTYVHSDAKTMRALPEPHPVDVSKAIMVDAEGLPSLPETPAPTTQAEAQIPPIVPPEVQPTAPGQSPTMKIPPRPGEARIPQATEGNRGGIVPRRPGDTIQRPVGPSRRIVDNRSAENPTPATLDETLMFAERPAVARNMKAEGERVVGEQAQRVAEGTLKEGDFRGPKKGTAKNPKFGEYGDVAYALGRSPYQKTPGDVTSLHSNAVDIPPTESGEIWQKGANAVIGDPEVKAALDLPPEANQEAVRDAIRQDIATRMGLPPDVSLAQIPPNVWVGWARSKGMSPGLIARMNKSIELARGKTGGEALPPNETPQTPMAARQATRPSEGEPIPFKRGTTNVEETPAARTAQPEQPETPMRPAPEVVPEIPAMGETASKPAPTGAKVPRTRKPKSPANERFVEPTRLAPETVPPVTPAAQPEVPVASTLAPKTRKAKAVTLPRTTEPESVAVKPAPEAVAESVPAEKPVKTTTTATKKVTPAPLPGKPKYNEKTLVDAGFTKVDSQLYKAQDGRSLEYDPDHSVWQIKRPSGEGTETFGTQKEAIESILGKPATPAMEAPVRGAKKAAPTVVEKGVEAKGKRAAKAAVTPKEVVAEKPVVAETKPTEKPAEPATVTSLPEPAPKKMAPSSVAKAASKEKISERTGMTKSQEKFVTDNLTEVGKQLEDEPGAERTIKVPGDGEFTVQGAEQANNLHRRITGQDIPTLPDWAKPLVRRSAKAPTLKTKVKVAPETGQSWREQQSIDETVGKLIKGYGDAKTASRRLRSQLEEFGDEADHAKMTELIDALDERARLEYDSTPPTEFGKAVTKAKAARKPRQAKVVAEATPEVAPEVTKPSPAETPSRTVSEETKPIAGKPSPEPKSATPAAKKPLADAIKEGQEPKSDYTNVSKLREQGYTDKEIFKLASDSEEFDLSRAGSKPNIEATAPRNAKGQPLDPSGEPYLKGTDGEYYTPQVTVRPVDATTIPAEPAAIVPGVKPAKPRKTLAKPEEGDTSGPSRLKELKAKKAELAKKGGAKLTFGADKEPPSGGTIMGGGFGSLQSLFEKAQAKRAKASPSELPHYDKGEDYVKAVREMADKGKFTPEEKTLIENTAKRIVLGAESVPDAAAKADATIRQIIGAKANPNVKVPKGEAAKPVPSKVEPVEVKTTPKKASTEPQTAEEYFQDQLDKDIWHSDKSGPANKANAEARAALAEAAAKVKRGKMTDEQKERVVGAAQDLMLAGKLGDDQLITNARKALKNASLNDSRAAKIWEGIKTSGRTIQTLRYGTDWSLGFKQAGPLTTNIFNVVDTAKAFRYAAGASKSQSRANEIHTVLESHPQYDAAKKSGLELTLFGKHEEVYQDNPAMKIPWIKRLEAGNNALVDYMRLQEFGKMTKAIDKKSGMSEVQKADAYKQAAEVINTLTGRTNLGEGKLKQVSDALNGIMASPRLNISRLKMADPTWIVREYRKNPVVAKEMLRQGMGVASTWMGLYALGATTGAFKVVLNPNDSDFGKIVMGNTRYDITGGMLPAVKILLQYARLGHSVANEAYENTDESKAQRQSVVSKTAYDTTQFLRGRLGPLYGYGTDIVLGKDFEKRPVTLRSTVDPSDPNFAGYRLVPPLGVTNAYESYQMEGMKGVAKTALTEAIGIGSRIYGKRPGYISRDSRVAQEMDDIGLPASQITRMPKEPNDVYKNRTLTVDKWTTTYGERLINSPEYKAMSPEMKVETLKELRSRITAESRKAYTKGESPDLNKLAPTTVMTSVTAAQKRLREKKPREFTNNVR